MKFSKGREFSPEITETKIDLYSRLMDWIEKVLLSDSPSRDDAISMLVLSRKVAFIASTGVLDVMDELTVHYFAAVNDGKLSDARKKTMMILLGRLSLEIRKDILEDMDPEEEKHILRSMDRGVEAITGKPKERKSSSISPEERASLKKTLRLLKKMDIKWAKIKMGYSVKDGEDRSIAHIYASIANRPSAILTKSLSDDQKKVLAKHLKKLEAKAQLVKEGKNIPIPKDITPEDLCAILKDIQ
ncbi:MAG: hypothetical protein KAR44_03105 [Candidatus Aegiribacteria sp.]|nr:hypothetical protein [Candidatus Aegiribacteria sp.]